MNHEARSFSTALQPGMRTGTLAPAACVAFCVCLWWAMTKGMCLWWAMTKGLCLWWAMTKAHLEHVVVGLQLKEEVTQVPAGGRRAWPGDEGGRHAAGAPLLPSCHPHMPSRTMAAPPPPPSFPAPPLPLPPGAPGPHMPSRMMAVPRLMSRMNAARSWASPSHIMLAAVGSVMPMHDRNRSELVACRRTGEGRGACV